MREGGGGEGGREGGRGGEGGREGGREGGGGRGEERERGKNQEECYFILSSVWMAPRCRMHIHKRPASNN